MLSAKGTFFASSSDRSFRICFRLSTSVVSFSSLRKCSRFCLCTNWSVGIPSVMAISSARKNNPAPFRAAMPEHLSAQSNQFKMTHQIYHNIDFIDSLLALRTPLPLILNRHLPLWWTRIKKTILSDIPSTWVFINVLSCLDSDQRAGSLTWQCSMRSGRNELTQRS